MTDQFAGCVLRTKRGSSITHKFQEVVDLRYSLVAQAFQPTQVFRRSLERLRHRFYIDEVMARKTYPAIANAKE